MILLHFEGKKEKKKKTIIYFEQGEKIQLKAKNQDASGQWPNGNQYKHGSINSKSSALTIAALCTTPTQ